GDVTPGRRDLPSVRQQRDAAAHGTRSRRRRAVAVRRRDRREDRQRRARSERGSAHVTRYLTTTGLMSTPFSGRVLLWLASLVMIARKVEELVRMPMTLVRRLLHRAQNNEPALAVGTRSARQRCREHPVHRRNIPALLR